MRRNHLLSAIAVTIGMLLLVLLLQAPTAPAKRLKTRVDKKRSIALPVKAKRSRKSHVPKFLRLTALHGDGGDRHVMHMACAVCQHITTHFVGALHYAESIDKEITTTGWRMDERKVVGMRGQDEKMMKVFDGLCHPESFKSMEEYHHCDEKTGKLCEPIPITERIAAQVKKSCVDFKDMFEEPLTLMARQYQAHTKRDDDIPAEFCTQIRACTGEENRRHGALFRAKSYMLEENPDL